MTRPRPPRKSAAPRRGSRERPEQVADPDATEVMPATERARRRAAQKVAAAEASGPGTSPATTKGSSGSLLPGQSGRGSAAPKSVQANTPVKPSRRERRAAQRELDGPTTGPSAGKLILAVALIVALDILLFFAIGFALGKVVL